MTIMDYCQRIIERQSKTIIERLLEIERQRPIMDNHQRLLKDYDQRLKDYWKTMIDYWKTIDDFGGSLADYRLGCRQTVRVYA